MYILIAFYLFPHYKYYNLWNHKRDFSPYLSFFITQKGETIFLTLMGANIKKLHIKEFPIAIQPITHFETQKKLSFQNNKYGITTNLLAYY